MEEQRRSRSGRRYDVDFKENAVKLVKSGRSFNEVAEELQHGIDEVNGVNAEAIQRATYSDLSNDAFHGEVFDRILQEQNGQFSFLTATDISILQQLRNGL